jgi:hypothetical protein
MKPILAKNITFTFKTSRDFTTLKVTGTINGREATLFPPHTFEKTTNGTINVKLKDDVILGFTDDETTD